MCERKHPTDIFISASLYYPTPYCNIYDASDLVGPVIGNGWGVASIWIPSMFPSDLAISMGSPSMLLPYTFFCELHAFELTCLQDKSQLLQGGAQSCCWHLTCFRELCAYVLKMLAGLLARDS